MLLPSVFVISNLESIAVLPTPSWNSRLIPPSMSSDPPKVETPVPKAEKEP